MTPEVDLSAQVAAAMVELAPDVAWIRWEYGEDWAGTDCLFFRAVLSDEAARERLMETVERVWQRFHEQRRYPYFNYRSESECKNLKDLEWQRLP